MILALHRRSKDEHTLCVDRLITIQWSLLIKNVIHLAISDVMLSIRSGDWSLLIKDVIHLTNLGIMLSIRSGDWSLLIKAVPHLTISDVMLSIHGVG